MLFGMTDRTIKELSERGIHDLIDAHVERARMPVGTVAKRTWPTWRIVGEHAVPAVIKGTRTHFQPFRFITVGDSRAPLEMKRARAIPIAYIVIACLKVRRTPEISEISTKFKADVCRVVLRHCHPKEDSLPPADSQSKQSDVRRPAVQRIRHCCSLGR
jgi:hypothetical protein